MFELTEDDLNHTLVICFIAAGVFAAIVVTTYRCCSIATGNLLGSIPSGRFTARLDQMQQSCGQKSGLIPSHKYKKGSGLFADQDGMCSVCLSEFEEGEELKTLPKCMHSFHASCIDMWFYSHSNCPMCRTNAAPSQQIPFPVPTIQLQQHNLLQVYINTNTI